MKRLIPLFMALTLCQYGYSQSADKITVLDPGAISKPINFTFYSEPWFWNIPIDGYWQIDQKIAEQVYKQVLLHFQENGYPEVVEEYPHGYQQYLGIMKEDIKLIYIVHISEASFNSNQGEKLWKSTLFFDQLLDTHSWSALYDTRDNKVKGVFFESFSGLSPALNSWPTIIRGKKIRKPFHDYKVGTK